jgi:hypothetical protein
MRASVFFLVVPILTGCERLMPPASDLGLIEPATFSSWPSVTEKPVPVGPDLWSLCIEPTPEQARERDAAAKRHGSHTGYTIVVRVSPEAAAAFREGKPLPVGAVVVKEKYAEQQASGPLHAYAVMVKRAAGYNPAGGDWEYGYVTLIPQRTVLRGRLAECAGCHDSARERDYLFRSYGSAGQ